MLLDFDIDEATPVRLVEKLRKQENPPAVTEQVAITHLPSQAATDLLKPAEQWGWEELRDYVVREIERIHGPFVRDSRKEASIFKSYISRYGDKAAAIAQFAFGPCNGMWRSAPISIMRFCRGSDPYFSDVILDRL